MSGDGDGDGRTRNERFARRCGPRAVAAAAIVLLHGRSDA